MPADSDQLPAILLTTSDAVVPAVIAARGRHAGRRFVEFFTANIRNPNTRKAYYRAACEFFDWCDQARLVKLLDIEPVHVAARVEDIGRRFAPPTVKQWLAAVRGPKYVVQTGKTPVLGALEARQLLASINIKESRGLTQLQRPFQSATNRSTTETTLTRRSISVRKSLPTGSLESERIRSISRGFGHS